MTDIARCRPSTRWGLPPRPGLAECGQLGLWTAYQRSLVGGMQLILKVSCCGIDCTCPKSRMVLLCSSLYGLVLMAHHVAYTEWTSSGAEAVSIPTGKMEPKQKLNRWRLSLPASVFSALVETNDSSPKSSSRHLTGWGWGWYCIPLLPSSENVNPLLR